MSFVIFSWGSEELIPTYWGYIDQSKIPPDANTYMIKSLAMNCEKCSNKDNWRVLEAKIKQHLFAILPLSSTKYHYKLYCNECNAFQMMLNKTEIEELLKVGIAIKTPQPQHIKQAHEHK